MKIGFWFLVAAIFLLYGAIIFATGIYYWTTNANVPNAAYHVSVWWGLIMIAMGFLFLYFNRKSQ